MTLLFHCPIVAHLLHRTLKVCLVEEFETLCIRLLLVLCGNIVLYSLHEMYTFLTKCEVKMAGYWPSSLFAFLWTETKSRSIKT